MKDLVIGGAVDKAQEAALKQAEEIKTMNKITGKRVDTNGMTRQSPRKYVDAIERGLKEEDQWIHTGNQTFKTVRGEEGYITKNVRLWQKAGTALETLGVALTGVSVLQAAKGDISPFALAPYGLGALTVIADLQIEEQRMEMMEMAVKTGYAQTKEILQGSPHAFSDFTLVEIDDADFEKIIVGGSTIEWDQLPSQSANPVHAVLIMRMTSRERGQYAVARIWVNQFKKQ